MVYIVGTDRASLNNQWKYSSAISKSAMSAFKGRSVSFFRISTDDCIIHDSISFG
jgi:hypothetical protein